MLPITWHDLDCYPLAAEASEPTSAWQWLPQSDGDKEMYPRAL